MPDWDWGANEEMSRGQKGEFLTSFVSARRTPNIAKLAFSSHILKHSLK